MLWVSTRFLTGEVLNSNVRDGSATKTAFAFYLDTEHVITWAQYFCWTTHRANGMTLFTFLCPSFPLGGIFLPLPCFCIQLKQSCTLQVSIRRPIHTLLSLHLPRKEAIHNRRTGLSLVWFCVVWTLLASHMENCLCLSISCDYNKHLSWHTFKGARCGDFCGELESPCLWLCLNSTHGWGMCQRNTSRHLMLRG